MIVELAKVWSNKKSLKTSLKNMLNAELSEDLGYEKHSPFLNLHNLLVWY